MKTLLIKDLKFDVEEQFSSNVWDSYEEHRLYDLNESRIDYEKNFGEAEPRRPWENRFSIDSDSGVAEYESFFSPDMENVETEYINDDIPNREDRGYHTSDSLVERTRRKNLKYYLFKLHFTSSPKDIAAIGKKVYQAQQKATISWTGKDDESITASIFFPAGGSKEFWDKYKAKKALVAKGYKSVVDEVLDLIDEYDTREYLGLLKAEIGKEDIFYEDKSQLRQLCADKIAKMA